MTGQGFHRRLSPEVPHFGLPSPPIVAVANEPDRTLSKAHDAQSGKVQGPACGQWCSETRGQEKAATEDRGKKGTKKSAKTSGCAGRRHDHRRDRGTGPRRRRCRNSAFRGLNPVIVVLACATLAGSVRGRSKRRAWVLRATHEGALAYCSLADLKPLAVDLA
jgi:hypothetical protein